MFAQIIASPQRVLARFTLALLLLAGPGAATARAQSMSADIVDTAVSAGTFTTLAAALDAAGLVDTLKGPGPFTVFAPTDAAFANLPAGTVEALLADPDQLRAVLTYHVVAGRVTASDVVALHSAPTVQGEEVTISTDSGGVHINDATVTSADIMASNGVIHVIDRVILPPSMTPASVATGDIVDTAIAAGQFTTLATALQAVGLVETLKGPGPFTVFAPTDAAFAKLPAGTVDALLNDPETLRTVLTYHVVSGMVTAADVSQLTQAATVAGEDVSFQATSGTVTINDAAMVTHADTAASNGIIHIIDTVLMPPSLASQPAAGSIR
jgi:uncharacterized surface protein with fasciclin (FAS1) repeats